MKYLSLFKKKSKRKNKYNLSISQKNNMLKIAGELANKSYQVIELWLISRDNPEKSIKVSDQLPNNIFNFNISLSILFKKITDDLDQEIYDWYLKVNYPESNVLENDLKSYKIETSEGYGTRYAQCYIRCGRFQHTQVDPLLTYYEDGRIMQSYLTNKGSLSLIVNGENPSTAKLQIDNMKSKSGTFILSGKIFTGGFYIDKAMITIISRENGEKLTSNNINVQRLAKETSKKFGLNRYIYKATIDLLEMNENKLLSEDIYDLFLTIRYHNGQEILVRVGKPTNRAKFFTKDTYSTKGVEAMIINPYYTFKLNNLSFETYNYPMDSFKYLLKVQRYAWILRLLHRKKDVWLIGERTYKAQDTGYHFFKYVREAYPHKNAYYVIDKDAPEKTNVEPYGNVLEYKSKEHIWNTIISSKVISSHHPDYLYPLRTPTFSKNVKADKVFLQHGVMGTKNMVANYGKNAHSFNTDLFMVSSDYEKEMIEKDFGYDYDSVFVTGLSRFDALFERDINVKQQLLIIPTWRDWIVTDQAFLESEYFERYRELINSEELHQLAEEKQIEIVLCLHPNMQSFTSYFEHPKVRIIHQGEIDVQSLLKESSIMITDYSSVAFDFSFLHKPIIYYQFDRDRFIGKKGSHLDLDNDLPGDIVFEINALLREVKYYVDNDLKMKEKNKLRANKFIKYRDQSSSERIFKVIQNNTVKTKIGDNFKLNVIFDALYNKFRKSGLYYPVMKSFFKYGRYVIPVDKKIIVFESGLGKQLGDSPKEIYDEIIHQELDYKKVWIYNKYYRFSDPKTKKIKRLTPRYYYYLLRAGYWVNNQNFPTYIKKRRGTTYLQTWHGTPLKKMLYDISDVQGRSDDYVDRVGKAIQNWDYLISPSPYASKAFKSAFNYKEKIIETGYPRNDIFYAEDKSKIKNEVLNRLHVPKNKRIILYAPTFRDNKVSNTNKFLFDIEMDLHQMKEQLGDEYIILLRMHVVVVNKLNIDESLEGFVYNASSYPDIQELQLISDVLITDYSSVMFDFANTGKPMLFYTYDLEDYRDNIRGFYMDFEQEAPGPLVFNTEEIIDSIQNIDNTVLEYQEKYQRFQKKYCSLEDGKASERVVNQLFK